MPRTCQVLKADVVKTQGLKGDSIKTGSATTTLVNGAPAITKLQHFAKVSYTEGNSTEPLLEYDEGSESWQERAAPEGSIVTIDGAQALSSKSLGTALDANNNRITNVASVPPGDNSIVSKQYAAITSRLQTFDNATAARTPPLGIGYDEVYIHSGAQGQLRVRRISDFYEYTIPDSDYSTLAKADSPLVYYRCTETKGVIAKDSSPNLLHGTYVGAYSIETEPLSAALGDALNVNASHTANKGIAMPELTEASATATDWTFEVWLKIAANNATTAPLFSSTPASDAISIYPESGDLKMTLMDGAAQTLIASYAADTWIYLVLVYDLATQAVEVFVDGASTATLDFSAAAAWSNWQTPSFNVGYRDGDADSFKGWIDDLAIYETKLDAVTIDERWTTGKPFVVSEYNALVLQSSPLVYYKLDEVVGSTSVVDISGHGQTGTVQGSATLGNVGIQNDCMSVAGALAPPQGVLIPQPAHTGDFSVEFWFKTNFDENETGTRRIFATTVGTEAPPYLQFFSSGTVWNYGALTGSSGWNVIEATRLPQHHLQWTHACLTYRASNRQHELYMNGALIGSGTAPDAFSLDTSTYTLGSQIPGGSASFDGLIDEFAIYPSILNEIQLYDHYKLARGLAYTFDIHVNLDFSDATLGDTTYEVSGGSWAVPGTLDNGVIVEGCGLFPGSKAWHVTSMTKYVYARFSPVVATTIIMSVVMRVPLSGDGRYAYVKTNGTNGYDQDYEGDGTNFRIPNIPGYPGDSRTRDFHIFHRVWSGGEEYVYYGNRLEYQRTVAPPGGSNGLFCFERDDHITGATYELFKIVTTSEAFHEDMLISALFA
jgi:hypothetical protein